MDFGAIETEIVTRLAEKIIDANLVVKLLPENEEEILPIYGKKQIVVAFSSEDAGDDENTSVVSQDTLITFAILLQGKLLRGADGLYPLAELVKKALIGFKPTDCREFTYSSHKFIKNDKKVFEYVLEFKTRSTRVQDIDEDNTGPAFTGIIYTDN